MLSAGSSFRRTPPFSCCDRKEPERLSSSAPLAGIAGLFPSNTSGLYHPRSRSLSAVNPLHACAERVTVLGSSVCVCVRLSVTIILPPQATRQPKKLAQVYRRAHFTIRLEDYACLRRCLFSLLTLPEDFSQSM